MPGHVFVVQGDLTHLACDDWLIPTDDALHVTPPWWKPELVEPLRRAGAWRYDDGDERPSPLTVPQRIIPLREVGEGPCPWLVSVVGDPVANAVSFVKAATKPGRRRTLNRARRLIAIPVIGTGWGGLRFAAGDVLTDLIPAMAEAIHSDDVAADVVVVTYTSADFAAAQHARLHGDQEAAWSELPKALRRPAEDLASLATRGRLVLFLGAGVGVGAGLPMWDHLLENLGGRAGLTSAEQDQLKKLGELDRGEYVAQRLQTRGTKVGVEIASVLEAFERVGLGHCLLAGLPCTESVTTNYDELFEKACADVGRPAAVLPYAPATQATRWLLKMHGCVSHADDIVLTRKNYLRYAERNAALAGIVQAMLITKHMLFLGFSLRDDNFLRIVDQVRRAVHPDGDGPLDGADRLGSAIMLFDNPLLSDLWRNEIDWVCLGDEKLDPPTVGRRFEIFLDYLSFRASSQGHLLDARFEGVLSKEDRALRALLSPILQASADARKSPAWPAVRDLLVRLGGTIDGRVGKP
jgi:SIR2-like domain